MLRIKEAIVVEGRYDKNALSQVVDTLILETGGFHIFKDPEQLALLRRAAEKRGIAGAGTARRIEALLTRYGLPTATVLPREALAAAALRDKKNHGGRLDLILPEAIGRCRIQPIPPEEFGDWLLDGGVV